MTTIHTSESVSEGHPDKLADQISDALLDAALAEDRRAREMNPLLSQNLHARVAIETLVTRGLAIVAGELTMEGYVDVASVVRETILEVGYNDTALGLDGAACGVMVAIQEQSPDIARGVDIGGAGDQGIMFGYATTETSELMPLPISMAHALMRRATETRKKHPSLGLRPDAKSQVSVVYENGRPVKVDTIVISQQHAESLSPEAVKEVVHEHVIRPTLEEYADYDQGGITFHINPTGKFVIGGPTGDTGLTGRKIIVDTYGGLCPHGGGAFSGKDPTKVDRSAAYMARNVAKTVVAAGLADRCQIGLAYAIGVPHPVAVNIETFGTERADPGQIAKKLREVFDLSPRGIVEYLDLLNTKFVPTAKNGHFGNVAFPWERTSRVDALKELALV
ncbi:MAG: methionine adenosyltransferase [Fimbriimonadaceae bacterium]|nr:methionine adenosyltransferase [Fimbriimonadaceae bacterium]QYK56301.1 MAG: methionine adenosyltransferase [Fimbriimonadaceae bacterium]